MKKVTTTLITVMLWAFASVSFAQLSTQPQWNRVLSDSPESFRKQLVSSSERSTVVNLQVPGFYTLSVTTPRGEAKLVTMPKALSTAKAGEPDLPMTGIPVLIGDQARMGIRVLDAQYMDFEGIEVAPSKGDFSRQIDPATVPYTYGECYSQDAFFPASNVGLYEPYIVRDFRGQNMVLYPYAYNPVTRTLRVYYDMTVEMYKLDDNGANAFETRRSNTVKMSQDFKSLYQRHFINYEAAMNRYTPLDEEGDLLIICYDNFISSMTDFVNWKKTRGINTTIVGTSTAGSSASAIKNYIQNQYNANNNLTHVLLVGDVAQIPGNSFTAGGTGTGGYDGKGDNLYGQIVGNDIYNDVIIGRFSASTAARVTTQCNRAITYERDLTASASWLQVAEGISRKEGGAGHNNEDDYQHMNNIRTDLLNYGYSPVYQRYANLSGYDGSSATISSDINSGVGIINYANHGQETAWGANQSGYIYYANSHVNALTNENKLPFIFSVACLVGKYDHSSDCFAEAWMNATNNNNPTGAIGTLMSYISQPWIPPMWAQDECVDVLTEQTNTRRTFGGISINGLLSIFDHYSTTENQAKGTYQAWIVYGDPTLMVRTKTPQAMTVTHPGSITIGTNSYAVNVTNGNGAVATITDASHNILGKATVSNGTATINVSGTLTVGSELTLCVFGYNKVTYLGTIQVVGGAQYTISTQVSPTNSGTVSGGGTYYGDTQCTLTATANNHYEFSRWTKNGAQVSTSNPYTFTVTGDATYVANFTALTAHTVTCSTVQNGSISASPTTAYKGETVTLTATPAAGYCLGTWIVTAGNQTITVTNNQFIMPDSNVTVNATFVPGYTVTLAPATNGSISASPTNGPAGTVVNLTATPASGYAFDSWVVYETGNVGNTVNVSGNSFTMPSYNVTVVGVFTATQSSDVTIGSTAVNTTGWTLPTHVYYNYSLTQQIYTSAEVGDAGTITAISFYYLGSSTSGTASSSGARTFKIYMSNTSSSTLNSWINESTSHLVFSGTRTFNTVGWYTITLDTPFEYNGTSNLLLTFDDNSGNFEVSARRYFRTYSTGQNRARYACYDDGDLDPINATSITSSASYNTTATDNNIIKLTKTTVGSNAYLSVSPTSMTGFTYPEGQGPSEAQTITVIGRNLTSNVNVTAPAHYEVSVNGTSYNNTATLTVTNGSVQTTVYVRLKDGLAQGNYNNETLAFVSGSASQNLNLSGNVAEGAGTYYNITVTADPEAGGTVTGGGRYEEATNITLTATANTGYSFVNWTKNGTQVSTSASFSFAVMEAGAYVAHFSRNSYMIQASANPTEGGTVTGAGSYYEGTPVNLIATANVGYTFLDWTKNGEVVSTEPSFTFNVTAGGSYVANFEAMTIHSITVNQAEGGIITANPTTAFEGDLITLTVTTNPGSYFVEWVVKDVNNQSIVVTNNQFTMPNSDVTVTAVFAEGFQITVADCQYGFVVADKENALPGETVTVSATPDNDCIFSAWYVFKSGDTRVALTVVNGQFTMPAYDVTVMAIFLPTEEEEVLVGSGSNSDQYLPTRVRARYSLTEQIYTASEIGTEGTITAIAFKANTLSATRSLTVYIRPTTKTAFSSTKDWETMGNSFKVFQGSVTFNTSGWTTITLDTPFEYDGVKNLNICVVDNTGSTSGSNGNYTKFATYSTGANRALYVNGNSSYANTVGYSSSLSSTTGARSTSNSQITFTMTVLGSAESLTVAPNAINGFNYEEGNGPSDMRKLDLIGVDLSNDITLTAPQDFEISATANGPFGNTLTIERESAKSREVTNWDFEGTFLNWTTIDKDGDGNNWVVSSELYSTSVPSHSGSNGLTSQSYANSSALTPDNWLVSPQVSLGGVFSMWACAQDASWPAEHFGIYVSTTSNTNTNSFTLLNEWTMGAKGGTKSNEGPRGTRETGDWYEFSVDLSAYSGQTGYIAVRHFNCTDMFAINVDDFKLNTEASFMPDLPVTLTPSTVYVRLKDNLGAGDYSGTLTANVGEITSNVSLSGQVTLPSQSVTLTQGWNWWTPMLEASVDDLQTALADYNATILLPESGALNVVPGKLYKIQVAQDCEVLLSGHKPASVTVTFDNGLSGFGFTGTQETTIGEALNGLNPVEGDMVNSFDEGFAIFNGTAWEGTLTTLKPGQGYEYLSKSQDAKSVTF